MRNPTRGCAVAKANGKDISRWQVLPLWAALGVFFLAPLAIIVAVSFGTKGQPLAGVDWIGQFRSGAFLENYRRTFSSLYLWIFWRSLWMAIVTTLLCLLVSYPVAYYIAVAAPRKWKGALLALCVIPFWTSFLVRTYAWVLILRTHGVLNESLVWLGVLDDTSRLDLLFTQTSVLIGLVYGELPFMILPLYASIEKLDLNLLEAASDLGAGRLSRFCRVTFPLTLPGVAAGVVLVFIPSIGQFVVSDLLGGAKSMLIGNLIQNQFGAARNQPFGSALAMELIAVVMLLLLAYAAYARRRGWEAL